MHINQFKTNNRPSQQSKLARGEITKKIKTEREISFAEARQTVDLKSTAKQWMITAIHKTKQKNLC